MRDYRITHFFQRTLPLAAALVMTGCLGPRAYDVTSKPAWWGEMRLNEVVELNQDALVNGGELVKSARKFTRTGYEAQRTYGVNVTVEMFRSNPQGYWADLYLLPKGTMFRCVKLERWFSEDGALYRVSGEILSGDHKGQIVFIIPYGDPYQKGSLELGPSPLVRPVEIAQPAADQGNAQPARGGRSGGAGNPPRPANSIPEPQPPAPDNE
jgi:hypothetical protein